MTKNCNRDYEGSLKCLEDSLRRLRTDHIDLWQFHEMVYDNDPDWVFEKGRPARGAGSAESRQGPLHRLHRPQAPRHPPQELGKPHDWDTAQMPINVMDAHYRSFQKEVVPECLRRNVGVIGMKGYGGSHPRGIMEASGLTAQECYRYALSQPVSAQVVGLTTLEHLKQATALARGFRPLTDDEKASLVARVKDVAG
jgi:aryl-alcohol dehydrogenase-like predicted oxidoreductase